MSMLSEQIKELREAARNIQGNLGRCMYRRKDVDEMQQVSGMLFEAADTIESLRDRLQNQAFALGMQEALGSGTCELQGRSDTCTNCGASVQRVTHSVYEMGDSFACHPNFCPNCGARIRKAVER